MGQTSAAKQPAYTAPPHMPPAAQRISARRSTNRSGRSTPCLFAELQSAPQQNNFLSHFQERKKWLASSSAFQRNEGSPVRPASPAQSVRESHVVNHPPGQSPSTPDHRLPPCGAALPMLTRSDPCCRNIPFTLSGSYLRISPCSPALPVPREVPHVYPIRACGCSQTLPCESVTDVLLPLNSGSDLQVSSQLCTVAVVSHRLAPGLLVRMATAASPKTIPAQDAASESIPDVS